jgi:hypothetical protein
MIQVVTLFWIHSASRALPARKLIGYIMNLWFNVSDKLIDFTVNEFKETVKSPLAAAIEAVNVIVENYPAPYNLLVSGGIDSQAMLYAWKMSNHPFNAVSFRYNQDFNWHDIKTLPQFCEQENIEYKIIDFDYLDFLENEYDSIARKYRCSSPQIAMHIKMAIMLPGTRIFSGNFLSSSSAPLSCAVLGIYRFSMTEEGKNTIPYFFLHTPELAYSFNYFIYSNLYGPVTQTNFSDQYPWVKEYQMMGFPIIPQEKKFTGFEKFKEHYDSHQYVLMDKINRLKYHDKPSHRPFDWIFRYPYEKMFGDSPLSYVLNPNPLLIIE